MHGPLPVAAAAAVQAAVRFTTGTRCAPPELSFCSTSTPRQAVIERSSRPGATDQRKLLVNPNVSSTLAWYARKFGYVFEHFGPVRGLEELIADVTPAQVAALAAERTRWNGRGQMGEYWAAVRPAAD